MHGVAVSVGHSGGTLHTPAAALFDRPAHGTPASFTISRAAFASYSSFPSGAVSTRLRAHGGAGGDLKCPNRPRASLAQASGPIFEPPTHAESRFAEQVLEWLQAEKVLHKQVGVPIIVPPPCDRLAAAFGTPQNWSWIASCDIHLLPLCQQFCTEDCSMPPLSAPPRSSPSTGRLHECRSICPGLTAQSSLSASTISSSCTSCRRPAPWRAACLRTRQPF